LEVEGGAWLRFGFAVLGIELLLNMAGVFLTQLADRDTEVILNGVVLRGQRQQQGRRRALVISFVLFTVVGVGIALGVGSRGLLFGLLGLMCSRAIGLGLNSKFNPGQSPAIATIWPEFGLVLHHAAAGEFYSIFQRRTYAGGAGTSISKSRHWIAGGSSRAGFGFGADLFWRDWMRRIISCLLVASGPVGIGG